jgi:hypothetical protein
MTYTKVIAITVPIEQLKEIDALTEDLKKLHQDAQPEDLETYLKMEMSGIDRKEYAVIFREWERSGSALTRTRTITALLQSHPIFAPDPKNRTEMLGQIAQIMTTNAPLRGRPTAKLRKKRHLKSA